MAIQTTAMAASPTANTIYTSAPSSGSTATAITTLIFCNTNLFNSASPTANTITLTLHVVPNGNSAGSNNMIVNAMPIPAGETFTFDTEKIILSTGDFLVAYASASGLTSVISYMSV